MKTTNLTVQLQLVTPDLAQNYLNFNNKNRKVSQKNLLFLCKQMKEGKFLENGESIVFDSNGQLKDGQHRLMAILKTGKSYYIPIVRGVKPISMATYDTGKSRSAADVLSLNGFKYPNEISGLILGMNKYLISNSKSYRLIGGSKTLTHLQVLEYCEENYYWLIEIVKKTHYLNKISKPKVLSTNQLSLIAYMLGGENPSQIVYDFLNYLSGVSKLQGTSTSYLFTKLYNSKVNKEPLNFYWILGMTIKAYNFFIDGNPAVNYFKFSIDQELPKIN